MRSANKKKVISVATTLVFILATINLFGGMVNSLKGQSGNDIKVYYIVPEKDDITPSKTETK